MKIAVGADDAAFELRDAVVAFLEEQGITVEDLSAADASEYYPSVAERVATAVANGQAERGVLMCGTGIGMSITANKVPGVRAALCHDTYSAERARKSNDAQILTMGGRVVGVEVAKSVLAAFLGSEFAGGRSAPKVELMGEIDSRYRAAR